MTPQPRSWAASIVGFALAVLVACAALSWAAELLLVALPVLAPTAAVVGGTVLAWRWYSRRPPGW